MREVSIEATWLIVDYGLNKAGVAVRLHGTPLCLSIFLLLSHSGIPDRVLPSYCS